MTVNKYLVALAVSIVFLGAASGQRAYIDPMGGYTQVVATNDGGVQTIFVSGQVGTGDGLTAQAASAFAELARRLNQAGASVNDVVKIRVFARGLDAAHSHTVAEVMRRTFPRGSWPAATVAEVNALAREQFLVEVEAIAVVAGHGSGATIERFAPSNGLSGAVAVEAHRVKTVYVSAQAGGEGNFGDQAATAWDGIGARLQDAGASYADLVKTTTYIVDLDPRTHLDVYEHSVSAALEGADVKPASTLIGVPGLAAEGIDIAIDAIAVTAAGRPVEREFIEPEVTYTQVVTARGEGPKTVYFSGQVGRLGDPLADQADGVYAEIARRLELSGAATSDLLKITVYIPGYTEADLTALGAAREAHGFSGSRAPASTLLGVQSLHATDAAIEIEGIAVAAPQER